MPAFVTDFVLLERSALIGLIRSLVEFGSSLSLRGGLGLRLGFKLLLTPSFDGSFLLLSRC
jgi:hypothetical protein